MGTGQYSNRKKGSRAKDKTYKRTLKHSRAGKFVDQIQDEIRKVEVEGKPIKFEDDEDLPGCVASQAPCPPAPGHGSVALVLVHRWRAGRLCATAGSLLGACCAALPACPLWPACSLTSSHPPSPPPLLPPPPPFPRARLRASLGKFYCLETDKHFMSQVDLDNHMKSRAYKRRVKDCAEKQCTQDEADWGSGKTKEVLPPVGGKERVQVATGAAASSTDWMTKS